MLYAGVSLAGVSCRRRPLHTALALTTLLCELSGYVKLEAVGRKFSHRPGNPATVGVVRWPSAVDTVGYRLRWPKLTPVSLISMVSCFLILILDASCPVPVFTWLWTAGHSPGTAICHEIICFSSHGSSIQHKAMTVIITTQALTGQLNDGS